MNPFRLGATIAASVFVLVLVAAALARLSFDRFDEDRRAARDAVLRSITASSTVAEVARAARERRGLTTVIMGIGFVSFVTTPVLGDSPERPICPRAYDIMFGISDTGIVLNPEPMNSRCGLEAQAHPAR